MEPIHIFYKELPVDQSNIFTVHITGRNEVENVRFKKLLEHAVTGLSINQDIGSALVAVTDVEWQIFLSNTIQKLVKEKKEPNLDLKLSNPEAKRYNNTFKKKTDCSPIKLTFYNTTAKKNEEIEFYNYFQHLLKFGFVWEDLFSA